MTPEQPPNSRYRGPMTTILDEEESLGGRPSLAPHVRDRAIFTQMAGLEAGRVCSLSDAGAEGKVTFGRETTCTHAFDDASLSRVHARLVKEDGGYVLYDSGSRNGVFVNEQRIDRRLLEDGDRVRLGSAVTLRFQMVDEKEEQSLVRVFEASVKDGLTGVWNRKYLDERLRGEIAFATRHKTGLAAVLVDIDHFKKVNDTYGHLTGDEVLRSTAATMRATLRTEDLLARYGGEEFVVLARGLDLKQAMLLAERLRMVIERQPVVVGGRTIARTISAGVATLEGCGATPTGERILAIADERLYKAKETGRNRVVGG